MASVPPSSSPSSSRSSSPAPPAAASSFDWLKQLLRGTKVPPPQNKKRKRPENVNEADLLRQLTPPSLPPPPPPPTSASGSREFGTQTEPQSDRWFPPRRTDKDLSKEEFEKKYTDQYNSVLRVVTVGDDGPEKAVVLEDRHEYSAQPVTNGINTVDAMLRAIKDPESVKLQHDSTRAMEILRQKMEEEAAAAAKKEEEKKPDNKPDNKPNNKPDDKPDNKPVNKPDDKPDNKPDNKPGGDKLKKKKFFSTPGGDIPLLPES